MSSATSKCMWHHLKQDAFMIKICYKKAQVGNLKDKGGSLKI